jgi:hypothetical protein
VAVLCGAIHRRLPTSAHADRQPAYPYSTANHLTEFDWAQRADGTLVAVATLASVPGGTLAGQNVRDSVTNVTAVETQYGCVAMNFDMAAGFQSVVAVLDDLDTPQSGASENPYGANGCTYEPMSNTGIIIVRRLIYAPPPINSITQQIFSLTETGIMP